MEEEAFVMEIGVPRSLKPLWRFFTPSAVHHGEHHEGTPHATEAAGDLGRRVTILSMEGGGVQGVILATILQQLEEYLQELDGPEMRIVDYFDLIAGTSTGGLITAMLATPSREKPTRPMFTTAEIIDFYKKYASQIFPPASNSVGLIKKMRARAGPKYDPQGLEVLLTKYFRENTFLSGMLTPVIIPSYDVGIRKLVFFSSMREKRDVLEDAPLHLVCRATLATRSYFPPILFILQDNQKREKVYYMIDGGGHVKNPTFMAITKAIEGVRSKRMCLDRVNYKNYGDLLVLSLGTGNQERGLTREMFLLDKFKSQGASNNYLQITTGSLKGSAGSLDDSSPANLDGLVKMGAQLLNAPVAKRDTETGELVPATSGETNREALKRFAQLLSQERKARPTATMKPPKNQVPSVLPAPAAPAAPVPAESKPDSKSDSKSKTTTTEPAKAAGSAQNPKTAGEKMMASQVEVQERAYVTFPYHPPQQFFDYPFQRWTHNMGSGCYRDVSFMDSVCTGRSNFPESSESSGSWRGDQSTTATFPDYSSDNCESDQGSYTYYESAFQMSYPETQSTNLSSQPDQGRYQDYFNIFS